MESQAASAPTDKPTPLPEAERRALAALKLPEEDGVPLESPWHRLQINLLYECIRSHWSDRTDFFVGGNMYLYYSPTQERATGYRGPDLFVVRNVNTQRWRRYWAIWEWDNKPPNLIVELLSESSRAADLGWKRRIYEDRLHIPEYVCFGLDPADRESLVELHAWYIWGIRYKPREPNEQGWVWSATLEAWLGVWSGEYGGVDNRWLRLYDREGRLVPTRAEAERQRAEAAEQRLEQLKARLRALGIDPEQ
ncbi:MAG: Uma2 family endonuclease [Anaerolineae bacterium]|nr:Uma2 family endonuclease [Thermoflexales bacterium]MDW8396084.1 Uma2 family endonuclease [Anaerolineae bacterium]